VSKKEVAVEKAASTAVGEAKVLTGLEGLNPEDFALPRIKLMQALSPEVADGLAKAGDFLHTTLAESMGVGIEIVVLMVAKSAVLWNPRAMGGGVLARSLDGVKWDPPTGSFRVIPDKASKEVVWTVAPTVRASGLDKWGSSDPANPQSQPAADMMMNFYVTFPEAEAYGPAIVTCRRAGMKAGQQFAGALLMRSNASIMAGKSPLVCGLVYQMTSKEVRNPKGNFYVPSFKMVREVTPEQFARYAATGDFLRARGVTAKDLDGLDAAAATPADEDLPF